MKPPPFVRKRDGRIVPFDQGKIADAIYRAALAAGGEDRFLSEELASLVTLFLAKTVAVTAGQGTAALPGMEQAVPGEAGVDEGAVPGIEQIQDIVERVLLETGHGDTARAYILHRDRRARLRAAAAARGADLGPTLFDDRVLTVEDAAAERARPFSVERLARTVAAECDLDREDALALAEDVRRRLRDSPLRRIPSSLLASLVDGALLERGRLRDPRARSGSVLPRAVVEASLAPGGRFGSAVPPERAAGLLGGEVLRAHALADLLPPAVASAHLEGDLHVHGLDRPASLHGLTVSLLALAREGAPGAAGRQPGRAAESGRRFLAAAGRGLRGLSGYAPDGVAVPAANLLLAPLLDAGRDGDGPDPSPEDFREDAWHLLMEGAADPGGVPAELDLHAGVPAWAARGAVAVPGSGSPVPLSAHGGAVRALARALVAARASGDGLPPRRSLPSLNLVVDGGSLADPRAREVLAAALVAALEGAPCRIVLQRGEVPSAGVGTWREPCAAAGAAGDPSLLRALLLQRVTLNLPRAAFRTVPGDLEGFLAGCDGLIERAAEAHRARRSFLATLSGDGDGVLSPLFRRPRSRAGVSAGVADPGEATASIAVTGLNEAVAYLLGEELHEGDAAVKVGVRILASLSLRVQEASRRFDLPLRLDAGDGGRAGERFREADGREFPAEFARATGGRRAYTGGVSLRDGAPVDLLLRLHHEGRLHGAVAGAAFSFDPRREPGVSEEGLLALVGKALLHTSVHQVVLGERRP